MRTLGGISLGSICLWGLAACGDGGVGTDPGGGSGTLLVQADVDVGANSAEFHVTVERNGQDVDDAIVTFTSDAGDVTLPRIGGGEYAAGQDGLNGWYDLEVRAGEDWLDGGIETPDFPVITEPSGDTPLDPHTVDGGEVRVAWSGESGTSVRVRVGDFDQRGIEDTGEQMVPATAFNNGEIDVEVRRDNRVELAGGVAGSHLTAQAEADARILVTNPF